MPKTILITKPQYDPGTHYLFYWSTIYIKHAKDKGHQVLELDRKRANKKELTSVIKKMKPQLICFNGHGNYELIAGNNDESLVVTNENEEILKGTIVNILACSSGKLLGPSCIQKGTLAFIAYKEEFIFYFNNQKTSNPLSDERAKLFLEPANEVIHSLLKGHTVGEAYQKSQKVYLENIQKVLASNSSEGYLARYLFWDMRNQVCLGNQNSTL
ncbi:MAG: hypothetical protein HYV37_03000 [Candidatus Levyibacteriota bacterium]|nr:MAG: hypothetical protein HYV37_03000 [Candidatus Levybacteria bacterium]